MHRVSYIDPLHTGRHPFQVYILALCVLSGATLLLKDQTPSAIQGLLPGWLQLAWAIMLVGGSIIALFGSYWPGGRGGYANALTAERIGLGIVGAAAVVYGLAIIVVVSLPGIVAAGITLGFGLSCLIRARDIGRIIRSAIRNVKEQKS
jgi:hypothetical protein